MLYGIIIIIIFIVILSTFYNKIYYIEGYDDRYLNSSTIKCAKFCKTTAGCYGFAYDNNKNICYPSKSVLLGRSIGSLHEDDYDPNNTVCNKIFTITKPSNTVSFKERKENALFACAEKSGVQPQIFFHNEDKLEKIDEGQNLDFITDVDYYEVKPYRWPVDKYNVEQSDKLTKFKERNNLDNINESITNENNGNSSNENIQNNANANITTNINKYSNYKDISNYIQQSLKKGISNITQTSINQSPIIETQILTESKNSNNSETDKIKPTSLYQAFKIYSDFNKGKYLKKYKCIKNIDQENCLKYCLNDNNCIGTEWNPQFENNKQVCCPYNVLGEFIQRSKPYALGKFYLKNNN